MALGTSLPARMTESTAGHTYTISPTGNDSTGAGTTGSPWKTLSKAIGACVAGDIVQCRGNAGNYGVQTITGKRFGTSSPVATANPVTVMTFTGDAQATFVGQVAYTNAFELTNCQGIRFRNLKVAAPTNTNFKVTDCQNLEFDGCTSRDADHSGSGFPTNTGQGLLVSGNGDGAGPLAYSADIQIWNCVFTNNGGASLGTGGSQYHDHSIYIGGSGTLQNTATKHGCDGYVIANCLFFDSPCGDVIQIGGSGYNGFIVNNTFYNASGGTTVLAQIVLWAANDNFYWTQNNVIANNIFSVTPGSSVRCVLSRNVSNTVTRNLSHSFGGSTAYDPAYGALTGFTATDNRPTANPNFTDIVGTYGVVSEKDFNLTGGSPASAVALPQYCPETDIRAQVRPASPSLGAYELTPLVPTITPAAITATSSITVSATGLPRLRRIAPSGIVATSLVTAQVDRNAGGSLRPILPTAINASSDVTARVGRPFRAAITATSQMSAAGFTSLPTTQVGSAPRDTNWGGAGALTRRALATPNRNPYSRTTN